MNNRLVDSSGRRIEDVRLSVTDRCNLRCFYCLPRYTRGFISHDHWLSFDEIERVIAIFSKRGVRRLRLTGGAALVAAIQRKPERHEFRGSPHVLRLCH